MTTRRSIALILSPAGLLLISAGRLLIVANFNTTTAVTIASSGGFVNTLLGTVIPLVPAFVPYLALLLLLFRRFLLGIMTFIFVAFISPTSLTLTQGVDLVRADWAGIAASAANYRIIVLVILLVIFVAVWIYNRSFLEGLSIIAVMVAALTLLIAIPDPYSPLSLRLAANNEHHIVSRVSSGAFGYSGYEVLGLLAFLAITFIIYNAFAASSHFGGALVSFSWLITGILAVIATIAFFPYIHFIYPVPQDRSYYAEITHDMWLPAQRIELNTHHAYYGYVLASDAGWFTVLLANSRAIAYLPAPDVVSRSVCQPSMSAQPKQNPPLIPWLYHPPRSLPPCASQDEIALITSVPPRGGALNSPRGRGQGSATSTGSAPPRRAVPLQPHKVQPHKARSRSHASRRGPAHPDRRRSRYQHGPRSSHSRQIRLISSCTKITDTRWEPTFRVWLISVANEFTSVMRSSFTVCLASTAAGRDLSLAQSTCSTGTCRYPNTPPRGRSDIRALTMATLSHRPHSSRCHQVPLVLGIRPLTGVGSPALMQNSPSPGSTCAT